MGGQIIELEPGFIRASFSLSKLVGQPTYDLVEFFFTPNDVTVQFRAERIGSGKDFGENKKRLEKMRLQLGWQKIPILRNRRRALLVIESPL